MGDFQGSFTMSPPPTPTAPSSSNKSNLSMLYYGLVVVGTVAIALALYNFIIMKRDRRRHMQSQQNGLGTEVVITTTSSSIGNSQRNLLSISSFKYKKETGKEILVGVGDDHECPVCLSVYEEGEEVRRLPRCKHSFHATCIDMWLYSHFDCPVCRTPVQYSFCNRHPPENSRPEVLESGGVSV